MELCGENSQNIPQKIIIHLLEILFIWIAWWIMFGTGGHLLQQYAGLTNNLNGIGRREVIFTFNLLIFLRLAFGMFYLLKRKMPWQESISVPLGFAMYYIGFPLFVLPVGTPLDGYDILSIFVFLFGCILNTGGEFLRDSWKKKPENTRKQKQIIRHFFPTVSC